MRISSFSCTSGPLPTLTFLPNSDGNVVRYGLSYILIEFIPYEYSAIILWVPSHSEISTREHTNDSV